MRKYVNPCALLASGTLMVLFSGILFHWFMAEVAPHFPEYLKGDNRELKASVYMPFVFVYLLATLAQVAIGGFWFICTVTTPIEK